MALTYWTPEEKKNLIKIELHAARPWKELGEVVRNIDSVATLPQ
jgi:hypothetical protein